MFHKLLAWGWANNTKSVTGREEQPNSQVRNTVAESSWMGSVFPGHDHTEVPAGERKPASTAVGSYLQAKAGENSRPVPQLSQSVGGCKQQA